MKKTGKIKNSVLQETHYNVGLDIGTSSVGYAVVDADTGKVLVFKKKNMLGGRLFNKGETAKATRVNRSTRRRYDRRRERIKLLRCLMWEMVDEKDPDFFARLDEGFLMREDKTIQSKSILFNDKNYTDKDYYKEYATIYHLRKELFENDEQKDIRLVYLALHHLIKYRGHFLYEGQNFQEINNDINELFVRLYEQLAENCQYKCEIHNNQIQEIVEILKDTKQTKSEKKEVLKPVITKTMRETEKKAAQEIVNAILGKKINFNILFGVDTIIDNEDKALKLSFAEEKYDEQEDYIYEQLQEKAEILDTLKEIYSWFALQDILKGEKTVASAMVKKYEKHKKDLKILRNAVRKYCTPEEYKNFFIEKITDTKKLKKSVNYVNYIGADGRGNTENLYNEIKKLLEDKDNADKDIQYILKEIDAENFLPLLRTKENISIPYQLTVLEAARIIDNQGKYYPQLLANKDKILSIIEFRIPYYVGPMNTKNRNERFSWACRKEGKQEEKIYPWNWKDIIDEDKTAARFIERMRNTCTYLPGEDVLPRYSLLYSEFVMLNELNKIKVNGKFIEHDMKQKMIEGLFKKQKNVTEKSLINYLKKMNYMNTDQYKIEGYQKEKAFASSLASYIDFTRIFGEIHSGNRQMIEEIIEWLTLFEEKSIVKRQIQNKYGTQVTAQQLEAVCKLRYKGWGNCSAKLLKGLKTTIDGDKASIIDILNTTNYNFIQIITNKKYEFAKQIDEYNEDNTMTDITIEDISRLHGSPAIKKGIWQTVKVMNELVQIMGHEPDNIFIEFARGEDDKVRTKNRSAQIDRSYKKWKKEFKGEGFSTEVEKELKNKKYKDRLNEEKMYLYFLQNGKCMYSGETLDIDKLSLYHIDHILPQTYTTDDSIENKVLVLGIENENKADNLLISQKIRNDRKEFWRYLYECGLMGEKKYKNLTRNAIGEGEIKGFINRQLVETRQIIKNVTQLFTQRYANSNVLAVRAGLSSNYREKYGLYKSREINDFHHAHDAFLAVRIGMFLTKRFPGMEKDLIYDAFLRYRSKQNKSSLLKSKHGYLMTFFDEVQCDENGVVIWNPDEDKAYIKSVLYSGNCQISRKKEELTGKFYNETIYPAGSGDLIPLKKNLSVEKYGGYLGKQSAYYVAVQDENGKKQKKIIGIPIYVKELEKTQPGAIDAYIKKELKITSYRMLKDKICKYQEIIVNGNELYLTSAKEVINAKQFFFGEYYYNLYEALLKCLADKVPGDEKDKYDEKLVEVYNYIISKAEIQYKEYKSAFEKIKQAVDFSILSYEDKIGCLKEVLKITGADAECADITKYCPKDSEIKGISRIGRKNNYTFKMDNNGKDNMIFVDKSVTGLYERRYTL